MLSESQLTSVQPFIRFVFAFKRAVEFGVKWIHLGDVLSEMLCLNVIAD